MNAINNLQHSKKLSEKRGSDQVALSLSDLLTFHPAGVSLNPIIVYFANQEEMDQWFGLLKENIEANGGTATSPENYTRVKVSSIIFSLNSTKHEATLYLALVLEQ